MKKDILSVGIDIGTTTTSMKGDEHMKKDILSVGIDIGTTTTSMIVSRLGISNTAASYRVPEVSITTKDIIYRSPLYLTPQKDRDLLDGEAIRQIVEKEYRAAGIRPEDVDTGAVIITGESSLKENAQIIIDKLSTLAGEFVVATAGPDLESILAGRGSGAEAFSKKYGCVAANLDIGGGTTNVSVFNCGNLEAQTCIDVGGRIAKYDQQGRLTYVSARLNDLGALRGLQWNEGETVSDETLRTIGNLLADTILDSIAPVHTDLTRVSTTSTSKPISPSASRTPSSMCPSPAAWRTATTKKNETFGRITTSARVSPKHSTKKWKRNARSRAALKSSSRRRPYGPRSLGPGRT